MYYKTSNQKRIRLCFYNHECNKGMYFAGLYETEHECDEIIFGFLRKSVIGNDVDLYAPTERSREDFPRNSHYAIPTTLIFWNPRNASHCGRQEKSAIPMASSPPGRWIRTPVYFGMRVKNMGNDWSGRWRSTWTIRN